jgi:hypothetical protein
MKDSEDSISRAKEAMGAGFAPAEPKDGRQPYDWDTKWPKPARSHMRFEFFYLIIFLVVPCLVLASHLVTKWCPSPEILGALAGVSGGSAFAVKWFYHSVAKGLWHLDRRYWRIMTPLLSGVVAFFTAILVRSDIINIFKANTFESPTNIMILGFAAGYFSDSAIAKFAEVAASLFGQTTSSQRDSSKD